LKVLEMFCGDQIRTIPTVQIEKFWLVVLVDLVNGNLRDKVTKAEDAHKKWVPLQEAL